MLIFACHSSDYLLFILRHNPSPLLKKSILRRHAEPIFSRRKGCERKSPGKNLELERHRKPKWIVSLKLFPELYEFWRLSGSNFLQYLALDLLVGRHGLINHIETKAKCRHLKILTCKGTLRQVFIWLSYTPPSLHCIRTFTHTHRKRGWMGRVEPERRLEGQQFTKLGRKYKHDWVYIQSINSDKTPAACPFTGKLFR